MPDLRQIAKKVRSKNAGPFSLTIDIFCDDQSAYRQVSQGLTTTNVAQVFDIPEQMVRRFDIPELSVIKFSLPRPCIQGTTQDRDMHGAAWGELVAEIEIP